MSKDTAASSGGIGIFGATFLLFLGLKLGHVIDWGWLAVTAPLWAPFSFFTLVSLVAVVILAIKEALS